MRGGRNYWADSICFAVWSRIRAHLVIQPRHRCQMHLPELFSGVLRKGIAEIKKAKLPLYTFAFYHDHESQAVSICADSEANSRRVVCKINEYSAQHFIREIAAGDLEAASLWQANIGRSLSLGDFAVVNAARTNLPSKAIKSNFYLEMVRAVMAVQSRIAVLAPRGDRLVFACSGENAEVGYVWSLEKVLDPRTE